MKMRLQSMAWTLLSAAFSEKKLCLLRDLLRNHKAVLSGMSEDVGPSHED